MTDYHESREPKSNEIDNSMIMALLSYLGPLVIIPYAMAKEQAFVKFHVKQGFVLLVIEAVIWLLNTLLWTLTPVFTLINIVLLVLIVVGILNVLHKEEKELPFVGKYARHFTF